MGVVANPPALLARRVANLIEGTRIDVSSEASAHRAISDVLEANGIPVQWEVDLGPYGRIDLVAGQTVGIEVKTRGGRRAIMKQTMRYLDAPGIEALVLATAASWPRSALDMLRKSGRPVHIASMARGWL